MRYLTLAFVAFFATSCTGENNSMRGYFMDMAEPPTMMMDSDGGPSGGSDRDRDFEESGSGRALTGAAVGGPGDPGPHGENIGGPSAGNQRGGEGTTGGGMDRGRTSSTTGAGNVTGGPNNQLAPRTQSGRPPAEAEADGDKAQRVREEIRRAVVTLGIPGTLARANTLF